MGWEYTVSTRSLTGGQSPSPALRIVYHQVSSRSISCLSRQIGMIARAVSAPHMACAQATQNSIWIAAPMSPKVIAITAPPASQPLARNCLGIDRPTAKVFGSTRRGMVSNFHVSMLRVAFGPRQRIRVNSQRDV
jgi:hypothetical protein